MSSGPDETGNPAQPDQVQADGGAAFASEHEQRLASELAGFIERGSRSERQLTADAFLKQNPELAGEVQALEEIDGALEGPPEEAVPESLSGYRILGRIGAGGMGCVYAAADERLGRKVAIKTLHPRWAGNNALRDRFLKEARAMARAVHPNIARIYSLGPDGEPPHFVMEYIEGAPLTGAARGLSFDQKADLMRKVALAVAWLHEHGILHRDLKPGNILVEPGLEPKLVDFGLALGHEPAERITRPGEVVGTPDYLAPEQASGSRALDARTDVFALGAVLYELLTGVLPFRGGTLEEQLHRIRHEDPQLPRRVNREVPGALQNICLKALEKDPAARYAGAREFAADLERYLAGEPVLASPLAIGRATAAKTVAHLEEISAWHNDRLISDGEFDALRKDYERLAERDDVWILEARRLTVQQVALYLGAWVLVMGAALLVLFRYEALKGVPVVLTAALAAGVTAWIGVRAWREEARRIGIAYLLAFCLLAPLVLLIAMAESGLLTGFTRGAEKFELFSKLPGFKRTTNAQLWWALAISLAAPLSLRRFTRSSVFALAAALFGSLLCLTTLLRLGLLDWIETDPGRTYLALMPCAALFLLGGMLLERLRYAADSRYVYAFGIVFTLVALTGVAALHEPYARWLERTAPWTRGQIDYLFLINAGAYLALQYAFERPDSAVKRGVAKVFRFFVPGHVLTPLLLLGISATERLGSTASPGARMEARVFEFLLPAAAAAFVFGSVPKQMKNFFATGLLFVAIGVVRLQQNYFKDSALWPVFLLAAGTVLMLIAARYAPIRTALRRILGKR